MDPQLHLRRRLLVAVSMIAAMLASSSSPASAQQELVGGVDVVAELDQDESIRTFLSGGATVLVVDRSGDVAALDVFTGERTSLELPEGFSSVRTISSDGAILFAESQSESIGGDDDDGLHDVYVHDLGSATTTSVSSSVAGSSHQLVGASADGSTVLFQAIDVSDGANGGLWVWRDGTVTELTALSGVASPFSFYDNRLRVSDDGSTLTGSRRVGLTAIAFHFDLDSEVLTERVMTGSVGDGPTSRDGDVVAWLEYGDQIDAFSNAADLVVWRPADDTIVRHRLPAAAYEGPLTDSGDGSRVFLTRYTDSEYFERSIVSIDTDDGSVTEVVRSSSDDLGFLQLLAADDTGRRLAFTAYSETFDINGEYAATQTVNVWDESGDPSPSGASPVLSDQIERLYRAYFGRAPDAAGLAYWIDRRVDGLTLAAISQAFASSPEFSTTYGALDDGAFVDLVYANVLGRNPDAEGRAFWVGLLGDGVTRGAVMIGFSESTEFATTTGTSAPMSAREASVRRLHRAFFLSAPSDAAAADLVAQLDAGVPLSSIAGAFAQTEAFAEVRNADLASLVLDFIVRTRLGTQAFDTSYDTIGPWVERTFDGTFELVPFMLFIADHPEFVRQTGLPAS